MKRQSFWVVIPLLLLIAIAAAGCAGDAEQPMPTATSALSDPTVTTAPTEVPATETAIPATETSQPAATATIEPTAAATETAPPTEDPETAGDPLQFQIVSEESDARFTIGEELFGQPKTVVGTTNAVSGTITVDLGTISNTTVSSIRIDASTLETDSGFRNRAIRERILQTDREEFRYVTFTPTDISGLPAEAAVGEAFAFQITGDLTVRDITNSVTFDVSLTPISETRLEGTATTTVTRDAYNLEIPNVPNVANVSNEVGLALDFVAVAG